MSTFVLVHGSWTGGWLWSRVRSDLILAGHRVLTPDLLGLGSRVDEADLTTGLQVHVRDLVALLENLDLREVVLVGHSYAGMLLADVATAAPQRVARLVYVDAFLPDRGQSAFDLLPGLRERFEAVIDPSGWRVEAPDFSRYGLSRRADLAWLGSHAAPMPIRTHSEPAGASVPDHLPATYVGCTGYAGMRPMLARAAARSLESVEWPDVNHLPMVTHPRRLAIALIRAGRGRDVIGKNA